MKTMIRIDDIVGAHEISERLGGSQTSIVHVWRMRHRSFPKPVAVLHGGMLWDWNDIEAWAKKTKRLK
jgi:predicted DNA-binding transcriptional regulator AlpA